MPMNSNFDKDILHLVKEAMVSGISKEEFRKLVEQNKQATSEQEK